jgi:hypothetical protein
MWDPGFGDTLSGLQPLEAYIFNHAFAFLWRNGKINYFAIVITILFSLLH